MQFVNKTKALIGKCCAPLAVLSLVLGACKTTPLHREKMAANLPNTRPHYKKEKVLNEGLVRIPTGNITMQGADKISKRNVTVTEFYMDATEVTNAQYKEFVNWVRDSIAAMDLGYYNVYGTDTVIDWHKANNINYNNANIRARLASLLYDDDESTAFAIDPSKLVYRMQGTDIQSQVKGARYANQSQYDYEVSVYPDTLVWMKDFPNSNNSAMTTMYFSHPTYQNYPVVGVSWVQAMAFCDWRTKMLNKYMRDTRRPGEGIFRLPTEAEWELACKGNERDSINYWGNPSLQGVATSKKDSTQTNYYVANFKQNTGNYGSDGALYTVKANSYFPNAYGLYNMLGNVQEWTMTTFTPATNKAQINPSFGSYMADIDNMSVIEKVVKGGSWKDARRFVGLYTRDLVPQTEANSYTGFRCVINLSSNWK